MDPPERFPLYVVVDNVRSLFNVGAIFRLCDAVRVARLYLCGITGHPSYPGDRRPPWVARRADREIAKVALRTAESVPWEYRASAPEVVAELRASGVQIVALEQTARSTAYTNARYRFPLALVLGHERAGVDLAVLDQIDLAVEIPMYGQGTSLNVGMAFGICAYEIVRQRLTIDETLR